MTAPTPESLGTLFAEVWDLCDQYAATITDAEVEAKLSELLAMRRPAAPLAPSDPALDVDLDAMYAAELPPCVFVATWDFWQQFWPRPAKPCGRKAVAHLTLHCEGCDGHDGACCRWHARLVRSGLVCLWCMSCGGRITVRGLS